MRLNSHKGKPMNTDVPANSFTPSPPPGAAPVSPSTAQRPRRQRTVPAERIKATKKTAKKITKKVEPKVPKNLHAVTDVEIKADATKKKRAKKAKTERAAPETVKVSLKEYAIMRVGDEHAKLFLKMHKLLGGASAGTRRTVLSELATLFG